jgi:AAHS family 4-hydroxybenzoate transporter-like MFS transporter
MLWTCTFLSMGTIALLAAWMPTFFQSMAGVPIQQFALVAMLGFFGSIAGTLGAGWLMDHLPVKVAAPAVFAGWATLVALLGQVPFGAWLFPAVIIVWNLLQASGQTLLNVLLTRLYPARMRSTAVGWAGGAGRVGGVVLPLFGGYVVAANWSIGSTFLSIAIAPLMVALVVLCLRPAPSRAAASSL